jgi:hypothetical protein
VKLFAGTIHSVHAGNDRTAIDVHPRMRTP